MRALLLAALLALAAPVHAAELSRAPIVVASDKIPGVLIQIGWFRYPTEPGIAILYCVPKTKAAVECVVYGVVDGYPPTIMQMELPVGEAA